MRKPLAIDLYAGLGGWTEALLAEGWDVIGFDNERHDYGTGVYPGQLVLQDVCTLHGAQFVDADLIVASSPCQEFSYRAMPWKRAKALGPPVLGINLFWQAFRVQHEIFEACGRHVPLVAENVRGAQPWVGKSVYNYGSFHLWGDIPALMPSPMARGGKNNGGSWFAIGSPGQLVTGQNPDGRLNEGVKRPGMNWSDRSNPDRMFNDSRKVAMNFHEHEKTGKQGRSFQSAAVEGLKVPSESGRRTDKGNGARFTTRDCGVEGSKGMGIGGARDGQNYKGPFDPRRFGSKSNSRKAASAQIAKIPEPLARHIAQIFKPAPYERT